MGRNQDLRKKIAGCQRESRGENPPRVMKPHPSDTLIGGWQREIEAQEKRMALLTRRLKREW